MKNLLICIKLLDKIVSYLTIVQIEENLMIHLFLILIIIKNVVLDDFFFLNLFKISSLTMLYTLFYVSLVSMNLYLQFKIFISHNKVAEISKIKFSQ